MKNQYTALVLLSSIAPCLSDDDVRPNLIYQNGGCMADLTQKLRTCNSDDDDSAPLKKGDAICRPSSRNNLLDYKEVRIFGGGWDSRVFSTWVLQILLSELLGVPTTVENGLTTSAQLNFYAAEDGLLTDKVLGASNTKNPALATAYEARGDCSAVQAERHKQDDAYQPCAHFAAENWDAEHKLAQQAIEEDKLERRFMGLMGTESWFVTQFTVEHDPSLASWLGMQGESNRQKLADTFLRPFSWGQYCDRMSPNNCTEPDETASRAPTTEQEKNRMFVEGGLYMGHFQATEENNCTLHPNTCTGHIADYSCEWTSYVPAQTFYNKIALQSSGPDPYTRGYSYSQLRELWKAANATRSNLILPWWTPEALYQEFLGSYDSANSSRSSTTGMQKVTLPPRTQTCIDAQANAPTTCRSLHNGDNGDTVRQDVFEDTSVTSPENQLAEQTILTSPDVSCDTGSRPLYNLLEGSFRNQDSGLPEALQSPAYQVLLQFQLSAQQLTEILELQKEQESPRVGICLWARENRDFLQSLVPPTYPRAIDTEETQMDRITSSICTALGIFTAVGVLITSTMVCRNREKQVVKSAQIEFLALFLTGLFLVAMGAIFFGAAHRPILDVCCGSLARHNRNDSRMDSFGDQDCGVPSNNVSSSESASRDTSQTKALWCHDIYPQFGRCLLDKLDSNG
mmetsp:Transcript_23604/g.55701  ORF Transcript_23604/g.55701 Transcript_23604/m.55701 type:complete len:684 (-) Transcript_23604:791-2842(-)